MGCYINQNQLTGQLVVRRSESRWKTVQKVKEDVCLPQLQVNVWELMKLDIGLFFGTQRTNVDSVRRESSVPPAWSVRCIYAWPVTVTVSMNSTVISTMVSWYVHYKVYDICLFFCADYLFSMFVNNILHCQAAIFW